MLNIAKVPPKGLLTNHLGSLDQDFYRLSALPDAIQTVSEQRHCFFQTRSHKVKSKAFRFVALYIRD